MKSGAGTLAEFALVDKSLLRRKPESVSFEQAAAVPLAAHTAFFSLINEGGLKRKGNEGKKVFIVSLSQKAFLATRLHCSLFRLLR